jgi:hypothetical protein
MLFVTRLQIKMTISVATMVNRITIEQYLLRNRDMMLSCIKNTRSSAIGVGFPRQFYPVPYKPNLP